MSQPTPSPEFLTRFFLPYDKGSVILELMSRKCLLAVLAGAAIMFVWTFLSWMVIPWHQATLNAPKPGSGLEEALKKAAPEPGIYALPSWVDENGEQVSQDVWSEQMEEGPYAFISVLPGGASANMGPMMIRGFGIWFVGAFILCFLMLLVGGSDGQSHKRRVVLAVSIGLFVGLMGHLPNWNWWHFSASYTIVGILDSVIGWTLAGLAMAKILQPKEVLVA